MKTHTYGIEGCYLSGEQQNVDGRIVIEAMDHRIARIGRNIAVQAKITDRAHMHFQQVVLDNVEHTLELAKHQGSMLVHHGHRLASVRIAHRADATIEQQLFEGA